MRGSVGKKGKAAMKEECCTGSVPGGCKPGSDKPVQQPGLVIVDIPRPLLHGRRRPWGDSAALHVGKRHG